jgi:hypothetical protein
VTEIGIHNLAAHIGELFKSEQPIRRNLP